MACSVLTAFDYRNKLATTAAIHRVNSEPSNTLSDPIEGWCQTAPPSCFTHDKPLAAEFIAQERQTMILEVTYPRSLQLPITHNTRARMTDSKIQEIEELKDVIMKSLQEEVERFEGVVSVGTAGTWKDYLTPEVDQEFEVLCGVVLGMIGGSTKKSLVFMRKGDQL